MTTTTFDTLEYMKCLEAAGVNRQQAEAFAKAQKKSLSDLMEEKLVTKEELSVQISQLKVDLIKWMIGLFTGWGAILISIMVALRFLH